MCSASSSFHKPTYHNGLGRAWALHKTNVFQMKWHEECQQLYKWTRAF